MAEINLLGKSFALKKTQYLFRYFSDPKAFFLANPTARTGKQIAAQGKHVLGNGFYLVQMLASRSLHFC